MQSSCFREIFSGNGNQPFASGQAIIGGVTHLILATISDMGRPFVPYCGMVLNANGVYVPDSIANNIANRQTFIDVANACRNASIKASHPAFVSNDSMTSDYYEGYLDKLTYNDTDMYQRYLQLYGIVYDFWTNANAAWTNEQYYNALTGLVNKIINEADKRLYIPNAQYFFNAPSPAYVSMDAWKTANANFAGFLGIEFYQ